MNNKNINFDSVITLAQYKGQKCLTINCTQLGDSFTPQYKTAKQKRAVLQEWCEFLQAQPYAFSELRFGTRIPQELFDAVCHQRNLKSLWIKWGTYSDLGALSNLQNLKSLALGSGASVANIEPITQISRLEILMVENFQKINDYSVFATLARLKSLTIKGDGLAPKYICIDSLEFLRKMIGLEHLTILVARLKNKDYSPVLALKNLIHLDLPSSSGLYGLFNEIVALPNLKTGLLKEKPEIYQKIAKIAKIQNLA